MTMNNGSRKYQAVFFDLDGVLVDSMDKHVEAWKEAFSRFGIQVSADEILLREGEKAAVTAEDLFKRNGLEATAERVQSLLKMKREVYGKDAPQGLIPGARELLQKLKGAGYRLALVTGSVPRNIDRVMTPDEKALFDTIVTAEDVEQGKPSPEPFLTAARNLNIHPSDCIVVENAPLGIKSAKSAGMAVAAITRTLPADMLNEADRIVEGLESIWGILNKNGG